MIYDSGLGMETLGFLLFPWSSVAERYLFRPQMGTDFVAREAAEKNTLGYRPILSANYFKVYKCASRRDVAISLSNSNLSLSIPICENVAMGGTRGPRPRTRGSASLPSPIASGVISCYTLSSRDPGLYITRGALRCTKAKAGRTREAKQGGFN